MKLSIQQKVFVDALERGALAALSDEAQSDTSVISLIIKSVKIEAKNQKITFSSATQLITTQFSIPVDSGIDIKEEGEIVVAAKELYDWTKRQQNTKLAIALSKLDTPEIVNPLSSEAEGSSVKGIKRIGTVKIQSKDESKTGAKWSLDCLASDQIGESTLNIPSDKKFSITPKQLCEGFKATAFATMPKHYKHVYDSISFQKHEDKIYMVSCDTARAAVYEANSVQNNNLDSVLLVSAKFLSSISKIVNETEEVSFYHDEKTNKVYVAQGDSLVVKMTTAEKGVSSIFPQVGLLLNKKYVSLAKTAKNAFVNRLITTSIVNDVAALFIFRGNQMFIHSISSSKSPSTCDLALKEANMEFNSVWGVNHVLDFLKLLKDEDVELSIPEGVDNSSEFLRKSLKLASKQDPNWTYYIMPQDPKKHKYDQVKLG